MSHYTEQTMPETLLNQTGTVQVGAVNGRASGGRGMVEEVRAKAADPLENADPLDHLEHGFDQRVASALKRLGVPTRDDGRAIAQRLEEMNTLIKTLAADLAAPVTKDEKRIKG
jgi:Poly(hydroxyalcanoate) granule associated protein (phasin)